MCNYALCCHMFVELKRTRQTNPKCSSRLFRPSSVSCLKVKRSWKRFVFACVQSNIDPGWAVDRVLLCWGGPSHRSVLGDARHPRGHLWEQTEAGGNRWRLSDPGEICVWYWSRCMTLELNRQSPVILTEICCAQLIRSSFACGSLVCRAGNTDLWPTAGQIVHKVYFLLSLCVFSGKQH